MTAIPSLRPFADADAAWLVERHGDLYAREEGFDESFPVLVAEIVRDFLADHDPAREAGWVAEAGGQRLGTIFCVAEGPDSPDTAKLRLFFLEPCARGTGLAQRMIDTCIGFARTAGYRRMRLWTHASHVAACRLYAKRALPAPTAAPPALSGRMS